jgi:hypothetical protein
MITLDGHTYSCFQTNYKHPIKKYSSTEVGITGQKLRIEGGAFDNAYKLTLLCTLSEYTTLKASYAKVLTTGTPPTDLLTLVDEEGFTWNPAAGVDDATHAYGTGVWFDDMIDPTPLAMVGWTDGNRLSIPITLTVNASGISAS